jgi:hypothetical protein
MFVFGGKGEIVVATVGKKCKICEIFLSCAFFSSTWHPCSMASVINERAQKGERKESHNK